MKKMQIKGIEAGFITLHCSLSMFRSIDVEDLQKHKLTLDGKIKARLAGKGGDIREPAWGLFQN